MRVIVLALTLAFVAAQPHNYAPDFAAGNTYVYKYETLLLGGLPDQGLARAGLKMSSKVLISATGQNTFMLKLAEPEIAEFSGVWPKDPLVPAPKVIAALAAQLSNPVKFEYANGVVGKIFAPEVISTTVLNVYRGILNVLQLNIKRTQNVYEMQEAGAQGVCKTLYAISEDESAERIHLTKTRDLNHCQERVMMDIGLAYTEKCVTCQQDSKNLRGATAYNYVLKPVANGILILEATVNEVIQFSPFTEMNGDAQMQTKQSLVFLEIQRAPIVPTAVQYLQRGSLKYEFSTELLQTPIQLIKIINVKAQIVETLNHLVAHNVERVHEDAPLKFLELIQLLRNARFEDLEMLFSQYKTKPAYRQLILDAIPATGTPATLTFIKDKYMTGDLYVAETAQALFASIHMVTANPEAITIMLAMTVNNKIMNNQILRKIVLLGYGTMIAKYCAEMAVCPAKLIKPIQDLLAEAVVKNVIQDIILLLKVLGNAAHPTSLKPITKVLPIHGTAAASLPMRVHADAILALRNIAKKEPRAVQELTIQLYMDKVLHPELRILACIVLFETRPPMGLVTTLANIVKTEQNLQVASFTYSHMKSLTRSTIHARVAAACNVAIKLLSPRLDRLSICFSKSIYMDVYNNPLMLGAAASAFYINDAATILPRSLMAKTTAYLAGAAADILEVGVRTEGLQEVLLKNPELVDNVDRITKMKRVIKALSQWKAQPNSAPLASVYVKFFGQEIAFANIDKVLIDQGIAFATAPPMKELGMNALKALLAGTSMNFTKPLLVTEVRRILPTSAGLPMELSFYTAVVAAASVQVKAITTPPLPENFLLADLLKTDIQLETEVKPSIALNTFAVMGINTLLLQANVMSRTKLNTRVPSKFNARLNFTEDFFKIEFLPVAVPEQFATLNVDTFAVLKNEEDHPAAIITPIIPPKLVPSFSKLVSSASASLSKSSEILSQEVEAPIITPKAVRFEKKYCAKAVALGMKGCLRVATENAASFQDAILYKLVGKHSAALSLKPIEGEAIERLELKVQIGPKAADMLVKQINLSEDILEEQPLMMKLKKLLVPDQEVKSSSSSSSSSSRSSPRFRSSSNSNSSSSSSSSSNSSSSSSRASTSVSGTSSASTLASLFRASSSSSSSSASLSKPLIARKFQNNHKLQTLNTQASAVSTSRSSASSYEAITTQNKFLAKHLAPIFAIIAHVIKVDKREIGYEVGGYLDRPTSRLQIVLAALAADDNWKLCVDGVLLSKHKVTAQIAWGAQCKQYDTMITAETGLLGKSPAARLRATWKELPSALKRYAKKVYNYIPAPAGVIKGKDETSVNQLSLTVVATSSKTIELILKAPTRTVYKLDLHLPMAMPLEKIKGLTPFDEVIDNVNYILAEAGTAECSFVNNILTTFNNRKYKNEMPQSCYQVMVQDCTNELKFMVLLRKDQIGQTDINVKIADIDIDVYLKNGEVMVKVNGKDIPTNNLPYQHPTAPIQIKSKDGGIYVSAPSLGLHEVYVGKNLWRIKVVDWMKGQTCGLCGKADGETRQEYRTPNGRLTKSAVSFAHSWVLPAESCRDTTECRMKFESVQLESQIPIHGQESKCFSVEPVLRCLPGCFPVKTTSVTVGYHCLPADAAQNRPEIIYDMSVDLRETAEAHLACSCTAQCA
ncbi:vitellogenin-1-like isoform X2 [Pseudochaenichthys georgianus]|uniref:vitellogenin-1-like isoform X2 n=1 Tax=Pseudochaenichthys georgianus TaxID=52239 RepID=UPI00146E685D|nr:vitellogenin-1-like isoform X2 [Pseudochaenichthys georgianus]